MKSVLTVIFATFVLTACSTTATAPGNQKTVPAKNVYMPGYLQHQPGYESVQFVRDSGIMGAACKQTISVNGDRVFSIMAQQSITIHLPPGAHLFVMEMGRGSCPNETHSAETNLVLGTPQTYRLSMSSNFNVMFTRIR